MVRPLRIFFDGGCRPNPGTMETAVVVGARLWHRRAIGPGDSGEAEWIALLDALDVAAALGVRDPVLLGDSTMVVNQAAGRWACRDARLRCHLAAFADKARAFDRVRLRHVGRSHNLAGIALDRLRRGV